MLGAVSASSRARPTRRLTRFTLSRAAPSRLRPHARGHDAFQPARKIVMDRDRWSSGQEAGIVCPPCGPKLSSNLLLGRTVVRLADSASEAKLPGPPNICLLIDGASAVLAPFGAATPRHQATF